MTQTASTPASSDRPLTIGLFWHQMNSDNLGVGALTVANIELLRRAARAEGFAPHFLVLGWEDPRPFYFDAPDIENVPLRMRHLIKPGDVLGRAIARCDLVCDIGGGDSFTDIYGFRRFFSMWMTKFRSLIAGKPLILSPQTVGPFDTWWSRPLARAVMNRAALVVSRDAPSTRFLEDMQVRSPIVEATDVAMGLGYDPTLVSGEEDPALVKVGLNVSGLLFNNGYTQSNQFGLKVDYAALVREIMAWFTTRPEIELHLVPHVQSDHIALEDDRRVSETLCSEFPGVRLAPVFASPGEAKSYIAQMDFFMGARMHATIAAFSTEVPVLPMAYSRKFIGVFGTLGYTHVADCKTESSGAILAKVQESYLNRAILAAEIATALKGVSERINIYDDAVRQVLRTRVGTAIT